MFRSLYCMESKETDNYRRNFLYLPEMDDEDYERRKLECLDEMSDLEKQFMELKEK